jgi:FkbH-like protein
VKLVEALKIVSGASSKESEVLLVGLVCGFQPLHLSTFLQASLQLHFPERRVELVGGLFGDIPSTLKDLSQKKLEALALFLEWEDLDPRLGVRQVGDTAGAIEDIIEQSKLRLLQLKALVNEAATLTRIIVSLPTLPLPPLFVNVGWETDGHELSLRESLITFASAICSGPNVRIVSEQRLNHLSPLSERLDVKAAWLAGFPYRIPHASTLAEIVAQLVQAPSPRKGLITDLDNTLWRGIVGEVGAGGVSWDLNNNSQAHALYQQFLRELAYEGVLIAAASKNERSVVDEAFSRSDMIVPSKQLFPLEISWESKARAVTKILSQWNIGPESVVFVDDDQMELAEVQTVHPQITCLQFPKEDPRRVLELLVQLRDLFGKSSISEEDRLRLESVRGNAALQMESTDADGFSEALLERANAQVTFSLQKTPEDSRPLELINKTNQFNLNGRRLPAGDWRHYLDETNTFLLTVSYKDRFGALGKIAVLAGRKNASTLRVEHWVMSCRAFARRIEHGSLKFLFDKLDVDSLSFDYQPTSRNGPLTSFLTALLGAEPSTTAELLRDHFEAVCPRLFHEVVDTDHE